MVVLADKEVTWFKPDPEQPRKNFIDLQTLGESLQVRQIDPLQAKPDGSIIDGERRYRAALLVGIPKLSVLITDKALSPSELAIWRLTSFLHKVDLTPPEKTDACAELLKLNPGWTNVDLGKHLKIDPSQITRILAPLKTVPAVLDAFRKGLITLSDAYAFYQLSEADQVTALADKLAGRIKGRAGIRARRKKAESTTTVKQARTTCAITNATKLIVSGPPISLSELIDLLQTTIEAARKANRESLDIRTFEKILRDKAKGGA